MDQYTLVAGDVQYLSFYLKEKDPTTGSITAYDLSSASSIWFRMREYNTTINTLSLQMSTVSSPSCTLGFCRVLATIPSEGNYSSEIEVYESTQRITWKGPTYQIIEELG
jgi:hypothetical protein